jgi:dinuclear metal center YbgI/SA1388 family protein
MQLTNLVSSLNTLLNIDAFEDYCPNGLQVEGGARLTKVAFGVTACLEFLRKAAAWGAQAAVVHHGLFWKSTEMRLTGALKQRIELLLKNRISLLAYHLPLDAHPELGNNILLARALGLTSLTPFGRHGRQIIGYRGHWEKSLAPSVARQKIQRVVRHPVVWLKGNKTRIRGVGIISGGAQEDFSQAAAAGLDLYVTGEVSEYNFHFAREEGIHFMAAGHHATERFGIRALAGYMRKSGLEARFIDVANPI